MSVLPLCDPYTPWPELTRAQFDSLYTSRNPAELRDAGFVNEAMWLEKATPVKASLIQQVSVYVPCYNGALFLDETLRAIKDQTYPIKELFVVDDGSTDASVSIAERHDAQIIKHSINRGLAASRNTALGQITAPLCVGIDADTLLDPYWLERVVPLVADPLVAGVGGRLIERYAATISDSWRKELMGQHHGRQRVKNQNLFGCNSIIKTDVLKKLGGFDESCRTSFDDVDISERIMKAGFETIYEPSAICYHCRMDGPRSIADSAYRWRLPPFERKGVFRDPKLLSAKWITEVRAGITDIQNLSEQRRSWLLFPSYYMILHSILIDACHAAGGDVTHPLVTLCFTKVCQAVEERDEFSSAFKEKVTRRLEEQLLQWARKVPSLDGVASAADLGVLRVAIEELPAVLRFAPHVLLEIEHSFVCSEQDQVDTLYERDDKAVILVSEDNVHAPAVIECINDLTSQGLPYRIFFTPNDMWEARSLLEELRMFAPSIAKVTASGDDEGNLYSLCLSLALMIPDMTLDFAAS